MNNKQKGDNIKYRVHRLEINMENDQNKLEQFINNLEGEVVKSAPGTFYKNKTAHISRQMINGGKK